MENIHTIKVWVLDSEVCSCGIDYMIQKIEAAM